MMMSLASGWRGVSGPEDELAQDRDEGPVLPGQFLDLRPGGVEQADGVVSEVGDLDHAGPGAGGQAGGDVLAVLLVLVTAGVPDRVRHRGHYLGGAVAELPAQHVQGALAGAVGADGPGVIFDHVVQERGARDIGVGDAVVAEDPDGDP
jgi:hypothetical protein